LHGGGQERTEHMTTDGRIGRMENRPRSRGIRVPRSPFARNNSLIRDLGNFLRNLLNLREPQSCKRRRRRRSFPNSLLISLLAGNFSAETGLRKLRTPPSRSMENSTNFRPVIFRRLAFRSRGDTGMRAKPCAMSAALPHGRESRTPEAPSRARVTCAIQRADIGKSRKTSGDRFEVSGCAVFTRSSCR